MIKTSDATSDQLSLCPLSEGKADTELLVGTIWINTDKSRFIRSVSITTQASLEPLNGGINASTRAMKLRFVPEHSGT